MHMADMSDSVCQTTQKINILGKLDKCTYYICGPSFKCLQGNHHYVSLMQPMHKPHGTPLSKASDPQQWKANS